MTILLFGVAAIALSAALVAHALCSAVADALRAGRRAREEARARERGRLLEGYDWRSGPGFGGGWSEDGDESEVTL